MKIFENIFSNRVKYQDRVRLSMIYRNYYCFTKLAAEILNEIGKIIEWPAIRRNGYKRFADSTYHFQLPIVYSLKDIPFKGKGGSLVEIGWKGYFCRFPIIILLFYGDGHGLRSHTRLVRVHHKKEVCTIDVGKQKISFPVWNSENKKANEMNRKRVQKQMNGMNPTTNNRPPIKSRGQWRLSESSRMKVKVQSWYNPVRFNPWVVSKIDLVEVQLPSLVCPTTTRSALERVFLAKSPTWKN